MSKAISLSALLLAIIGYYSFWSSLQYDYITLKIQGRTENVESDIKHKISYAKFFFKQTAPRNSAAPIMRLHSSICELSATV